MKIGIIGAMDLEIEKLTKEEMKSEKTVTKAGMVFHVGRLGNTEAVIVKSGVGKVNAAICAQILIDCFDITHLINTGIAGSLCSDINVGDIVISTDAVYHDMDVTAFGYEPGVIPQMGTPNGLKSFPADPLLRQAAVDSIREDRIVKTFHPLCTEMEGTAIAHAAYLNSIPFVILRAISDKADEEATVTYEEFEHQAAENCAKLVAHMVGALSA